MRRLLLPFLMLLALNARAVDLCTVVDIGGSSNATGSNPIIFETASLGGYHPGDMEILHSGGFTTSLTSTTDPTSMTLLKQSARTNEEVWCKIIGRETISDPGITWGGKSSGNISILHNPSGFPNCSSALGDSDTNNQSASTAIYGALSVTQGGGCALQFNQHPTPTGNTNVATAVVVTGGYVTFGFAQQSTTNSVVVSSQLYVGDATTPDLALNAPAVTGNTDSSSNQWISLTLLSGDNIPAGTFTDKTGQATNSVIASAPITPTSYDNWTKVTVLAGSDEGCEFSINGGQFLATAQYMQLTETLTAHVTSGGTGTTKNCTPAYGDALTAGDTFSVSTAAGDTDPANFDFTGDVTLQELSSTSDFSNTITVTAIDSPADIVIKAGSDTGCAYSKNSAAVTSSAGTVVLNDTIKVNVTTSSASSTSKKCNVTIGTVSGGSDFTALTADFTPAGYDTFVDLTDVALGASSCSNAVALSGLTGAAAVSVDIGTCRVNSASYTGLTCGTAANGDTVQMCHTSSSSNNTGTTQTMSVGPVPTTATFVSTTIAAPSTTEAPILFSDLFTGGAGALTGHTPTTDVPGHGYTKVGSGTLSIDGSGKLTVGAVTYAEVDTDVAVYQIDVNWEIPGASLQSIQLFPRYTDANNYFLCQFTEETDQILLRKRVAGVNTTFFTITNVPITEATHSVGFFIAGDQIGCLLDHVEVLATTDSQFNTVQTFAFGALGAAGATFDNLYVKHAYPVVRTDTLLVPDDPVGLFVGETLNSDGYYWAKSNDLPDKTYAGWTLYEGGSWYYSPEVAYVGDDVWGWERWNPTTSAIETGTLTYTTQGVGLTAPVWQVAAINVSLPIGVPASLDLATLYLTTRGVLAASCSTNGTLGGMAMSDPANCIYSGTPNTGYTAAQALTFTATNVTGAPTKVINFTITGDGVPDFPAFTPVTSATPSASAVACPNTVTLTQANVPYAITVAGDTGCKYVKDGGAASAAATTGVSGTTLALQVDAGLAGTTKVCTATAGGISQACTVTASTPTSAAVDDFTFPTLTGVALLTAQEGCTTITGNTAVAPATVSGGTCTINGSTCPGNVPAGGGTVCAQHTSSAVNNTPTNTVVTISGKVGTFTSTTLKVLPTFVAGCIIDSDYELLVGDSLTDDLSSCWTNADTITMVDGPPDSSPSGFCTITGTTVACDHLTTEGIYITTIVATNTAGVDIRYLNWDIQESDVDTPVHPHPRRTRH